MNQVKSKPTITFGGKTYEVKYTFGAFDAMCEKYGVNVFDLPQMTPRMIAVIIWGGIIHVDPNITPDIVVSTITTEEAITANKVCSEVIVDSLPKRKVVDGDGPKPA